MRILLSKQIIQTFSKYPADCPAKPYCWIEFTLLNGIHRLPGDANRFSKGFLSHILLGSCNLDSDVPCDMKHLLHDGKYHKDDLLSSIYDNFYFIKDVTMFSSSAG